MTGANTPICGVPAGFRLRLLSPRVNLFYKRNVNGMTANFDPFDAAFLNGSAARIISEVKGINRVVHDWTSKPPGTIEWE